MEANRLAQAIRLDVDLELLELFTFHEREEFGNRMVVSIELTFEPRGHGHSTNMATNARPMLSTGRTAGRQPVASGG